MQLLQHAVTHFIAAPSRDNLLDVDVFQCQRIDVLDAPALAEAELPGAAGRPLRVGAGACANSR